MGFSSVIGITVIVIGLLIAGSYIYLTMDTQYNKMFDAFEYKYNNMYKKLKERLVIVSVSSSTTQTNITIFNNGSITVNPNNFTILFDGAIVPKENITIVPQGYLLPLQNVTFIVNWTQPSRICVVSDNGNKYFYLVG
ncbi:flagellar protein F [Methanocaldococcus indicus]|uniref:flagellar protein F n=1 Tax=Methanocaldococcus indicus TaxID=213231 RepID=UPI003C6D6FCC